MSGSYWKVKAIGQHLRQQVEIIGRKHFSTMRARYEARQRQKQIWIWNCKYVTTADGFCFCRIPCAKVAGPISSEGFQSIFKIFLPNYFHGLARTVPYFFVSVPCARLSWLSHQLLSPRKYHIISISWLNALVGFPTAYYNVNEHRQSRFL